MRRTWFALVLTVFFIAVVLGAPILLSKLGQRTEEKRPPVQNQPRVDASQAKPDTLKPRVRESFVKAADWLAKKQESDGGWKLDKFTSIGYTSLAAYALAGAPADLRAKYEPVVGRAVALILGKQNQDGSFSEMYGSNKSYVTSVVLMLLSELGREKYQAEIKRAQDFLVGVQKKEGMDRGGSGYGDVDIKVGPDGKMQTKQRDKADLSNSAFVIEALQKSGLPPDSEFYKNAAEFLTKLQQDNETNVDPAYVKALAERGYKIGSDGGFIYAPFESKAGEVTMPDGSKAYQSYGSMTYAGLKSMIYANVKKEDPRVQSALRWVKKYYTLEKNAGFGVDEIKRTHLQGIFYYYMTFAKAMDAVGEPAIVTEDGKKHEWARELAEKLLSIQKAADGQAWQNSAERWGELDPVLATSYVLSAYTIIDKWIK